MGPEKVSDPTENKRRYQLWYALASEIAAALRADGDETPILVGGANASPACALRCLPLLKLPNIIYTAHQYEPYAYTHQAVLKDGELKQQESDYNCGDLSNASPRPRRVDRPRKAKEQLERLYGLLQGFRKVNGQAPVAVNEFGVYRWAPNVEKHLKDEVGLIERVGANHALWVWEPRTTCVGYDAFNFMHGRDFSKHKPDLKSSLVKAVVQIWSNNKAFPNNVTFRTRGGPSSN